MAALQGLLVAGSALAFGYLISSWILRRSPLSPEVAWALSLPCLVVYSLILMLAHMASGGRVLSSAWLVRGSTIALAGLLLVAMWRRRDNSTGDRDGKSGVAVALALVVSAIFVWSYPSLRMIPIHFGPDTRVHMGYAHQLISGSPTPTAALSGDIPNFYPWLFHALVAVFSRFTPGGNPFHALVPIHFLFVAGTVLGLFTLGRQMTNKVSTGTAATLFGSLTGGFGFFVARGPEIVMDPQGPEVLHYLGDLLQVRSYNFALSNLVPPYPRDLTFALLPAYLLLLVVGIRSRCIRFTLGAGVVLGCIGLTGGEVFLVGMMTGVATVLLIDRDGAVLRTASVVGPAIALYAIWALPLLINYVRHGGFFDMSGPPVDLPLWAAAASWGITLPLSVYGLMRALPGLKSNKALGVLVAFTISSFASLVGSTLITSVIGGGFAPLSRRHRYWPLLYLGVALFAAIGATDVLGRLRGHRVAAAAFVGLVVILALPSPVLANLAYPEEANVPQLVSRSLVADSPTLLEHLDTREGVSCTVVAPRWLADQVFAYTGHRLVAIILGRKLEGNQARVRWRDIYEVTETLEDRISDSDALMAGIIREERWRSLVDKYEVDAIVAPRGRATPRFDDLRKVPSEGMARPHFLVWVGDCID